MTTVAIYCRISIDRQGKREGVDAQEAWGREYVAQQWPGAQVMVFRDNNLSGASDEERPEYEKFRVALAAGQLNHVWAVEQSRLERRVHGTCDWFALAAELTAAGIDVVHTRRDGIIRVNDLGTNVRALMNAHYVDTIRKEVRDKHEFIAAAGRPNGGDVFGYRHGIDDQGRKSLIVEQPEAEALRWAAGAVLDGWSLTSVARELTRRGFVGRRGKEIRLPVQVRAMLTNPTVAGLRTHRGVITTGCWEPILTQETWHQVRTKLSSPRMVIGEDGRSRPLTSAKFSNRAVRRYLLTGGLARCGVCKAPLIGCMQHRPATAKREKHSLPYLVCPPKNRPGTNGRGCVGIMLEPTEEFVLSVLFTELDTPEFLAALADDKHAVRRREIERSLEETDKEILNLAHMRSQFELTVDEWQVMRGGLLSRKQTLIAEHDALPPLARNADQPDIGSWFHDKNLDEQRVHLRRRIKEVVILPGKPGARKFDTDRIIVRSALEPDEYWDYESQFFTTEGSN